MAYIGLTMKGFCMGAADVVPGVSGGTMAFILGIYEELIKSIKSFDLSFLRLLFSLRVKDALDHASWQFLLAIGLGILTAIFTLARILAWLLQNQPVLIWSFFFGLIVASVFTVSKHLGKWTSERGHCHMCHDPARNIRGVYPRPLGKISLCPRSSK
jgi:putative membrane protein